MNQQKPCDLKVIVFLFPEKRPLFFMCTLGKGNQIFHSGICSVVLSFVSCFCIMFYPAVVKISSLPSLLFHLVPVIHVLSWEDEKRSSFLSEKAV